MSVTQFVWESAISAGGFAPDKPCDDEFCWLCGGYTEEKGWRVKDVVGSAFTDSNIAKCPASEAICQSCAALMKKEAWVIACEKFDLDPHFPIKDGKKPFLANWMFSSHVFSTGVWIRPDRAKARRLLINPPAPPFVITLADVGKKHVIFRSTVNMSKEQYFVNIDEAKIFVDRLKLVALIKDFERAYSLGFSKDSLLTGNYNQAAAMSVGLSKWKEIEYSMKKWRSESPGLMKLCHFCAQKEV